MTKRTFPFRLKPTQAVVLVALLVAGVATQGARAAEYTVTDLGPLSRGESYAAGVNESGQVVGEFDAGPPHGFHGFLYSGGTRTNLGTLGRGPSAAYALNAAGQVVGESATSGPATHAFLYSNGTMTDLGTLGGTHSVAYGINAAGRVVGQAQIPGDGAYHAFLYSDGAMTDLNDLVPADVTVTNATGINASGQIVGDGRIGEREHARALLLTPTFLARFAYALADDPTAASYTPDSRYAYNASGGIRITRWGVGFYRVAFDSLLLWGPGLSSAVAVTAYGSSPITCSVMTYLWPRFTTAQVECFDVVTQRMADSAFTIMVVGNQSLPGDSAFVMSGGPAPVPPPNPNGSWTSGSHPITVTHNGAPGDYNVLLGTGNTPMSAKLVTGTTGTPGAGTHCNHARTITGGLRVQCYDGTGTPSDQGFSVVQVAGGWPGRRLGFAWAHREGATSYTPHESSAFNSAGGAITATRASEGHYAMHFVGLQKVSGHTEHVQVTSYGLLPDRLSTCQVVRWDNAADGLTVVVECRDGGGQFVD